MKKSLDKIASPDRLNDYLRFSSSSVWVVLLALFLALAAAEVETGWLAMPDNWYVVVQIKGDSQPRQEKTVKKVERNLPVPRISRYRHL